MLVINIYVITVSLDLIQKYFQGIINFSVRMSARFNGYGKRFGECPGIVDMLRDPDIVGLIRIVIFYWGSIRAAC